MKNDLWTAQSITTFTNDFNIDALLHTMKKFKLSMTKSEYDYIGCTSFTWDKLKQEIATEDYSCGRLYGLPVYIYTSKCYFLQNLMENNKKGLWVE